MSTTVTNPQVPLGYGIPSIPKKTRDRILSGEYIDFAELPPAKGKTCPLSLPAPEGNIILVNAFDLLQQKKLVPDLGTWAQCFTIYAGVILTHSPGRLMDLLGYFYQISRASQGYRWPSWVIFDQNFRQAAADQGSTELAHLDPTLYAQCFNGQTKEPGNAWCQHCHSLEHSSDTCPLKPPPTKRPKPLHVPLDQVPTQTRPIPDNQVCRNFNKRTCKYGKKCRRIHNCLDCGGPHPQTHCPSAPSSKPEGPTHPAP